MVGRRRFFTGDRIRQSGRRLAATRWIWWLKRGREACLSTSSSELRDSDKPAKLRRPRRPNPLGDTPISSHPPGQQRRVAPLRPEVIAARPIRLNEGPARDGVSGEQLAEHLPRCPRRPATTSRTSAARVVSVRPAAWSEPPVPSTRECPPRSGPDRPVRRRPCDRMPQPSGGPRRGIFGRVHGRGRPGRPPAPG